MTIESELSRWRRWRPWLLGLALAFVGVFSTEAPVGAGVLDVSWTAPTTNVNGTPLTDLGSYRVYYGATSSPCHGASSFQVASSTPSPPEGQVVSYRLRGLTTGSLYYITVSAVDSSGNESGCPPAVSARAEIDFAVSPTNSVNFGSVNIGSYVDRTFTVSSTRGGTVSGTVSTSAPFSIVSGSSFTLVGPGATRTVTVRFAPTTSAIASVSLNFSADGDQVSRLVSGTGIGTSVSNVTIAALDATATEAGATTGAFRVSRTGSTASPLTVFYSVAGTATPGTDYTSLPGSVTIPAGAAAANILVQPINDTRMEGNETVVVTLSSRAAYTIGSPSSATVTITNDERVTIAALDATATEAGATTGAFRVSRTGSTASPLTVFYSVAGTATPGTDYTSLPGSVTIPAGAATANILIQPINDTRMEGNETVVVTLSSRAAYTIGSPSSATVTIINDERVTIAALDATATEAGATTGAFRVSRTGSTASPLTVFYSVAGTATPGTDYTALPGSVTIPAGVAAANILVRPINDTRVEGNETVVVTLSSRAAYTIGSPSSATVTIISNE